MTLEEIKSTKSWTAQLFSKKSRSQAGQNPHLGQHLRRVPSCNRLAVPCSHLHYWRWATFLSREHESRGKRHPGEGPDPPEPPCRISPLTPTSRFGSIRRPPTPPPPAFSPPSGPPTRPKTGPSSAQPPSPRPTRPPSHEEGAARRSPTAAGPPTAPTAADRPRDAPQPRERVGWGGGGRALFSPLPTSPEGALLRFPRRRAPAGR